MEVDAVWARLVASAAPEDAGEEEPEEVGDDGVDSPERREGSPAADIRVCNRVWRKEEEAGDQRWRDRLRKRRVWVDVCG